MSRVMAADRALWGCGLALVVAQLSCSSARDLQPDGGAFAVLEPGIELSDAGAQVASPVDATSGAMDAGAAEGGLPLCEARFRWEPALGVCEPVNDCSIDNGGCGDPAFVECVHEPGQGAHCEDIDECQRGDPCGGYDCIDRAGAPPLCDQECPDGSVDWYGDSRLCVAQIQSFHVLSQTHGCALLADGSLRCARGDTDYLPLRDGPYAQVFSNAGHLCAIRLDGRVDCPGAPPQADLEGPWYHPREVVAGRRFACLRHDGGALTCAGTDFAEELPLVDSSNLRFVDIDAWDERGCGVLQTGALRCWGTDRSGVLADFNDEQRGDYRAVELGREHGCALRSGGNLHCWSERTVEEPDFADDRVRGPEAASDERFTQLSVGARHTCGLREDGSVRCWGREQADEVSGPGRWEGPPFVRIDAMDAATCGFMAGGKWQCWGLGRSYGFAHALPPMAPRATRRGGDLCLYEEGGALRCDPGAIYDYYDAIRIGEAESLLFGDAGDYTQVGRPRPPGFWGGPVCGLRVDGRLECWEQLLNSLSGDYDLAEPSLVHELSPELNRGFIDIHYAAADHVCGLREGGGLECFSLYGSQMSPHLASLTEQPGPLRSVGVWPGHSCAVTDSGALTCWGAEPEAPSVHGPNESLHRDFVAVQGAPAVTCGVRSGGALLCWAPEDSGVARLLELPRQQFVQLAVASTRACGRREDGSVACAGLPSVETPPHVERPGPYVDLWQEYGSFCALTSEGALECWGLRPYDGEAWVVARRPGKGE